MLKTGESFAEGLILLGILQGAHQSVPRSRIHGYQTALATSFRALRERNLRDMKKWLKEVGMVA